MKAEATEIQGLLKAIDFAADKHRNQKRKDTTGTPYINHPIRVAVLLSLTGISDATILQAAVLHDTVEDTKTAPGEIELYFGPAVRRLVDEVTDDKNLSKTERRRMQEKHAPTLSIGAKLIKLADKVANVADISTADPANWTVREKLDYLDFAERVVKGLRGCNPELERRFDEILAATRSTLNSAGIT